MDAGLPLSARSPRRRLHLRHRRLLVHRHHARRRHADHRHGGDERLPQRAVLQDPRSQRPRHRQQDRRPVRGLRRGGQAHRGGARRQVGDAADRGPGHGLLRRAGDGCAGARHDRGRAALAAARLRQHPLRLARRLRPGIRHRHRHAPRQHAARQRRRHDHARFPARRLDAVRHGAAYQALRHLGAVRDGHGGIRPHHGVHAAAGSAALLRARGGGRRHRGRRQSSRAHRQLRARDQGRRPARPITFPTGGRATRRSSPCSRSSAT